MKNILIGAMLALTAVAHAATKVPVQMLDTTSSTSGQVIVSPGPSGAAAWGSVSAGALAPMAANTVLANSLGATAAPTAVPIPSCSGTNNALRWTSGAGFTCAGSVALTTSALNQFAATTSAQLAAVISDETGSGSLVFNTAPTLAGTVTVTGSTGTALQVTTSGSSHAAQITDTGSGGATLTLVGNGATTPAKTLRVANGCFQIINNAYSQALATMCEDGNLTVTGALVPSSTGGIVGTTTNNNASAGSVGEYQAVTGSATALTSGAYTDIAALTLSAGDWDVEGSVGFANSGATTNAFVGGLSTVANTNPNSTPGVGFTVSNAAGSSTYLPTPVVRFSLASSTTVRLGAQANFTGGTVTGTGMIRARRVR
ncbi:hypothetical protein [Burkholderia sp. BCC1047]|uniref:hypothetical protein n=1 Tax=Burkholderia sp. BCC1047 TaxID=2676299 RepID=UPI001588FC14|nr:hypothetical protein [Burkholderia sp. BCC1047]